MKKVLIMMMCVIMVVCFMPTVAMADGGDGVITVNTSDDFIAKVANGGSIKLGSSIQLTSTTSIDKEVTIDLNGNDITSSGNYALSVVADGKLTLEGPGNVSAQYCALALTGSATDDGSKCVANIGENVTLSAPNYGAIIWQKNVAEKTGTASYGVELNLDGTINGTAQDSAGIFVLGNIKATEGNVPVLNLGPNASVTGSVAVALNGYGKLNVNGAKVEGTDTGIEVRAGKLNVNSGTIKGNGSPTDVQPNGSGTTTSGAGIGVAQHTTKLPVDVTINDGTISGYTALHESNPQKNEGNFVDLVNINVKGGTFNTINNGKVAVNSDSNRLSITGGTFSSDPTAYVPTNSRYYVSQEGGKYVVRYSTPTTTLPPTTPTDNVTNSGSTAADNATTSADLSGSTSTSNGITSATVDKTTADKIVDKAVENKSTEVVIDATANTTTAANSTTIAQVTIPTEILGAIAEKTEADVTIKTDVAEVKMDNAAAAAVSEQAEGDTVQIIAEKVAEETDKVEFELKVVCSDGKVISNFNGGNIAVTVALPKAMAEKKVVCVYIDDNGHMSKVEGQRNADGTYTFVTGHFSSYAILAEEEADAAIAAQKEAIKNIKIKLTSKQVKTKTGKKGIKITWTAAAGDKVLDGVEVFRSKEKNKGYGTEPFYTSTKGGNTGSYTNTKSLKKGTKYYYRVRGYVLVNGEKVYTDYSTKAWRTVK